MTGGIWTIVTGVLVLIAGWVSVRELESVREKVAREGGDTDRMDRLLASKLFRRMCPTVGAGAIVVGVILLAT